QVRGEGIVGESVGVDRLQLPVRLHRGRLERLVPVAQLLPPELPLIDLLRTLEAPGELSFRNRPHDLVGEAVDVRHFERVDQHAVIAGELARPALEGRGMDLDPVARRRARKMDGVELPEAGAWGLEAQVGCSACGSQGSSFLGWISDLAGNPCTGNHT